MNKNITMGQDTVLQPTLSSTSKVKPKLYLLTNDDEFSLLYQKLDIALATGVVERLQIRRKSKLMQPDVLRREVEQLRRLTQIYDCELIINDDTSLAHEFDAGVHLGQDDGSVSKARLQLGQQAIIGRTCKDSIEWIEEAANSGASYVAMGAIFASLTKPNAKTVPLNKLKQGVKACRHHNLDFCLIGGITAQNLNQLESISIDYIAVVHDILGVDVNEIEKKCQQWQLALEGFGSQ